MNATKYDDATTGLIRAVSKRILDLEREHKSSIEKYQTAYTNLKTSNTNTLKNIREHMGRFKDGYNTINEKYTQSVNENEKANQLLKKIEEEHGKKISDLNKKYQLLQEENTKLRTKKRKLNDNSNDVQMSSTADTSREHVLF